MDTNRQARIWICTLYLDNEAHLNALYYAKNMYNTILMLHDKTPDKDSDTGYAKPHYHCIFKFENGYYLYRLLRDDLKLDIETNAHLFRTLKQEKFKRLDDYIVYLTHENTNKPDKYRYDSFEGGLKDYAIKICDSFDRGDEYQMDEVIYFLSNGWKNGTINLYGMTLGDIYLWLHEMFGSIVYKKWGMIREIVNDMRKVY